ncbi:MAG: hypothetical protein OXB93_01505 [Cytophagales bacterium]|nr:hypothetical protein [Cytophagales bacterium]
MNTYKVKRNQRIKKEFSHMYDKKKLRIDHCLNVLAERYGIQPSTIMHIIKGYGVYGEEL